MKFYTSIRIEKELWYKFKEHCEDNKLLFYAEIEKALENRLEQNE